jgi:uncharacterized oxidoreductase
MNLSGNTILITGGATGIGLALAQDFLERNNRVIICGRRQEKLDEAREASPGLIAFRCDISDESDRRSLLENLKRDGLAINVLINNAAVLRTYDLSKSENLDLACAERDLQINFFGPVTLTHLLLPMLEEQPDPVIINVSSPGGVLPLAKLPFYCASKAALNAYTNSLRHQLDGRVKVITLFPPSTDTSMMKGIELRLVSTEKFVIETMRRLATGREEIWIGEGRILPWLVRIAPKLTFKFINNTTKFSK